MTTQILKVDGSEHVIEVKPVTLVCPGANMAASKIEYPGRVELDPEATLYHADRVQKLHPEFDDYWRLFMIAATKFDKCKVLPQTHTPDEFRKMGTGAKHMMGLIDLTLKLGDQGVPLVWKYPESYLHPAWQAGLGDLVILFSKRGKE